MRKRRFLTQEAAFYKEENAALFSAYQRRTLFEGFERAIFSRYVPEKAILGTYCHWYVPEKAILDTYCRWYVPEKAILDTYCRCLVVLKEVVGLLFWGFWESDLRIKWK